MSCVVFIRFFCNRIGDQIPVLSVGKDYFYAAKRLYVNMGGFIRPPI